MSALVDLRPILALGDQVRLSRAEFARRFDPTTWAAIEDAAASDAMLRQALAQFNTSAYIAPGDRRTKRFADYAVAQSLMTQAEADAVLVDEYLNGETGP